MTRSEADGIDQLLARLGQADLFELVERVCDGPDPEQVATTFAQLARRAYSSRKSVSESVALARAGIQYCLCYTGDASQRQALRRSAQVIAFNLAADTWPGWGDEGIVSTHVDLEAGLDAARLDLRLVRELEQGALAESIAYWALGAHRLARAEYAIAIEEFQRAVERARAAGNAEHEQLNLGYLALVGTLQGNADAHGELVGIIERFEAPSSSNDGAFFAEQLAKALEIFQARLTRKTNGVAQQ